MGKAKDVVVKPISSANAKRIVKSCHYSGKVVPNSQLHFGVFLNGKCGGALQFGPPIDKRNVIGLVSETDWNGFLELNRMAFSEWLPRNSESRAISVCMRIIRKSYPHIKWILSFADGTQCGDGTIYRASGFTLTGIRKNSTIIKKPDGSVGCEFTGGKHIKGEILPGFQFRYIYFIDPTARERLTVPILPFSEIQRRGAGMYLGKPRAQSIDADAPGYQSGEGGSNPTCALHSKP